MLARMRRRYPISAERYTQIAFVAMTLLVVIVFTGAAVRLTGSGLGCPTWPKCTRTSVYSERDLYSYIEFGNRVLTFFVSAGAALAAVGAYLRVDPHGRRRRDLERLGWMLPLGVVAQAVLGGLSVLYKLAPGFVMAHFALSMVILVAAFELWWRSRLEPEALAAPRADGRLVLVTRGLVGLACATIFLGTASTAAGPHAGSAGTGEFVHRLDFKGSDTLTYVIHAHGYMVTLMGLVTIGVWWVARRRGLEELKLTLYGVLALLVAQGVVGIVQYENELPSELVWVHVCLACLTWVGYVHAWAAVGRLRGRSSGARGVEPARRPAAVG